jgi:hypothetical protein
MQHDKNRHSPRQRTAMVAAVAGMTLLTAACGSGGGSPGAAGAASPSATSMAQQALEYAQCMRQHGVKDYPDPTINGNSVGFNVHLQGVSHAAIQAAQQACQSLSPQNFAPAGTDSPQNIAQATKWAACIREHGVPDFPDPGGNGSFNVSSTIDLQGAAYLAASKDCQSVAPKSLAIGQAHSGSS